MNFDELLQFVERDMRMSHLYQPVMLRELLSRNGRATVADIARALFTGPTAKLLQDGYLTQQMITIRRLCDVRRDVISLRRA